MPVVYAELITTCNNYVSDFAGRSYKDSIPGMLKKKQEALANSNPAKAKELEATYNRLESQYKTPAKPAAH